MSEGSADARRGGGTGRGASGLPRDSDLVRTDVSMILACGIDGGAEIAADTETGAAPALTVASSATAARACAPDVSAFTAASSIAFGTAGSRGPPPTCWVMPMNVMAPTRQVTGNA